MVANRPVFLAEPSGPPFYREVEVQFRWYAGLAATQAQKCIAALHEEARAAGLPEVLEISTRAAFAPGRAGSALLLPVTLPDGRRTFVESAFQGSKVLACGGPYQDIYDLEGAAARRDTRPRAGGEIRGFRLLTEEWPAEPKTAFYDFLYLTALVQNPEVADVVLRFKAFSDISFNPEKSLNCQARSAAIFVALSGRGLLGTALRSQNSYLSIAAMPAVNSPGPKKPKRRRSKKRYPGQTSLFEE